MSDEKKEPESPKCRKCGKQMMVECIDDTTKRAKCPACGLVEVLNQAGQRLLTDDIPAPARAVNG